MNNVQLLQLAQSTAAMAVTDALTPFALVKSSVAAFTGAGNPDSDWPLFTQNFQRELGEYRAAALKDVPPPIAAGRAAVGAAPAQATIPADVFNKLPADVQATLIKANPALAASAPAPVALPPAAPIPSAIGTTETVTAAPTPQ